MPTTIGPFEILSELSKSPTGTVYKANDPETGQTIALKTIQLSEFGEQAAALEEALLAEAESTKVLSSSNITPVFGAGAKKDFRSGIYSTLDGSCAADWSTQNRTTWCTTTWNQPRSCAAGTAQ
jgi:serine/threonine protein kinase